MRAFPFVCHSLLSLVAVVTTTSFVAADELLVSDRKTNRVLKYDLSSGDYLGELIGPSNPLSGSVLNEPTGMILGPGGDLFVSNRLSGKVERFDPSTGAYLGVFASGLQQPNDLVYRDGKMYVSNLGALGFEGQLVSIFDDSGSLVGSLGAGTAPAGRSGLAFGSNNDLFVGSFFDRNILRFDLTTLQPIGVGGVFATLPETAFGVGYVRTALDGNLLVTALFSASVFEVNSTTGAVSPFIGPSQGLLFPNDIEVLADGTILATSLGNDDPFNGIPLGPGYVGRFDGATGATIDQLFISGSPLLQPSSLLVISSLLGDINGDGFVGQDDLNILLGQWGQTVEPGSLGDVSNDGFIGQDDLNFVLADWGKGTPPVLTTRLASVAVVPEVGPALLTGIALFLLLAFRLVRRTAH